MDNLIKINGRESHFIGIQRIQLGEDVYYDLSEQKHRPWFVLVLDSQGRHDKRNIGENN